MLSTRQTIELPIKQWLHPLIQCGPVRPYGNSYMDQLWLRQCRVSWRHQAITWTDIDLSSVRLMTITWGQFHKIQQPSINIISFKITYVKSHLNIQEPVFLHWKPLINEALHQDGGLSQNPTALQPIRDLITVWISSVVYIDINT